MKESGKDNIRISTVTCSQCGNKINDPALMRCPRCYKPLLPIGTCSGSCSKCREKGKTAHCG